MGTDDVRRSAARVRQIGEEVGRLAEELLAVGTTPWRSAAAEVFRRRLAEEIQRVQAAVGGLNGAAEALFRHARAIESGSGEAVFGGRR
jgi:uncharacterized small protein (DUF1192 family)